MQNIVKIHLSRNFQALHVYIRKEKSQINDLTIYFKKEKIKIETKLIKTPEITKIKAQINEVIS